MAETAKHFGVSKETVRDVCKGIAPQIDTYEQRELHAIEIIRERAPLFDYAGGYSGVDSPCRIRCKVCGTETVRSFTTIRQGKARCAVCSEQERKEREEAEALEKERRLKDKEKARELREAEKIAERKRKGGLGLYYHIDMNGGPWNDRWVNTTTVPKLREQLNLAYKSGIDRIWIINVGDLKPKEMPISFIMDYAWNPKCVSPGQEEGWLRVWTQAVFGGLPYTITNECADIIAQYSRFNLLRKPEVQVPGLFNYEEMLLLNDQWQEIVLRCEALKEQIPTEAQDAFYQLVYYPAVASAGVAMMYNAATMGSIRTVEELMKKDQQLSDYYNKVMAGGKWDGMMLDNHIGYTKWSIPNKNTNPMNLGFKVDHNALSASKNTKEYTLIANTFMNNDEGWIFLPNLGRYEGCMGAADVMKNYPNGDGPALEYDIDLSPTDGKGTVAIGILPTQDVYPARGLRLGVQIDDQPMQVIDARQGLHDEFQEYTPKNLAQSKNLKPLPPHNNLLLSGWKNGRKMLRRDEVFDNIRWLEVNFEKIAPGKHKLKLIMIDPEIVVESIVVNPDNNHYSYFGNMK